MVDTTTATIHQWQVTFNKEAHKTGKASKRKWFDGIFTITSAGTCKLKPDDQEAVFGSVPLKTDAATLAQGDEINWLAKEHNIMILLGDPVPVAGQPTAALNMPPPLKPFYKPAPLQQHRPNANSNYRPPATTIAPTNRQPQQQTTYNSSHVDTKKPRLQYPENARQQQHRQPARERSNEEIMGLLSMRLPAASKPVAAATAPPPVQYQQQQQRQEYRAPVPPPVYQAPAAPAVAVVVAPKPQQQQPYVQQVPHNQNPNWNRATAAPSAPPPANNRYPQQPAYQQQQRPPPYTSNNGAGGSTNNPNNNNNTSSICLPPLQACTRPQRTVSIPDTFTSPAHYATVWKSALTEEISLRLTEVALPFHNTVKKHLGGGSAVTANASSIRVDQLEKQLRQQRVEYYGSVELFMWRNNTLNAQSFQKKKRKQEAEEYEEEEAPKKAQTFYLILKSGKGKASTYRKNDLWLISNNPLMQTPAPGQPVDRTRLPWVAAVKSAWHGPNKEGKFEVEFIGNPPTNLGKTQQVYAIKAPDVSIELSLLDVLQPDALNRLPIMPHLLGSSNKQKNKQSSGNQQTDADAEELIVKFKLNEEQADVVRSIAQWSLSSGAGNLPFSLIHGPFGTGKSSLLVAILHLILVKREKQDSALAGARVLVSAHTNVAVDRVLEGLQKSGCTNFLRVGSVRRISKELLGRSLHCSESSHQANAVAELKLLLNEASNPHDKAIVEAELRAAEGGADRARKRQLKTTPIVGVTCCSASLNVFENQQFDIVILDECSQIIEPLSMMPIVMAGCKYLIAAGDPLQLPPVISSPTTLTQRQQQYQHSMVRPLFSRLASPSNPPFFLRRQYRCHPDISSVANTCFYNSRLLNGCTAEEKASLITPLPNIVFLDAKGQEEYRNRSIFNRQEGTAVMNIVSQLLHKGIRPSQIGIVCFYRAQVWLIEDMLKNVSSSLGTGTAAPSKNNNKNPPEEGAGAVLDIYDDVDDDDDADTVVEPEQGGIQVATVDSFQGAEKDIIILSTATQNPGSAFATDGCRLNVALTRCRHNLIVVGNAGALKSACSAFEMIWNKSMEKSGYCTGVALPL